MACKYAHRHTQTQEEVWSGAFIREAPVYDSHREPFINVQGSLSGFLSCFSRSHDKLAAAFTMIKRKSSNAFVCVCVCVTWVGSSDQFCPERIRLSTRSPSQMESAVLLSNTRWDFRLPLPKKTKETSKFKIKVWHLGRFYAWDEAGGLSHPAAAGRTCR